jgi:hypothetical protein
MQFFIKVFMFIPQELLNLYERAHVRIKRSSVKSVLNWTENKNLKLSDGVIEPTSRYSPHR